MPIKVDTEPESPSKEPLKVTKQSSSFIELMRKSTTKSVTAPPKNYKLSYFYAFLAAIFFGLANYCGAEVSKLGTNSLWTSWPGALLPMILYHLYHFIATKMRNEDYFDWTKSNYVIEVEDEENPDLEPEYLCSIDRVLWMLSRGIC